MRPIWEGHLKLSLVSCPVALYGATSRSNDVRFHFIHKKTHHRIRMVPHDPELGPVERKDLVRGFEATKNRYVVLTDAEIAAARIPSTKAIDIDRFVGVDEIDRIYWNDPYYLVPDGTVGLEAYLVIREAMKSAGKIALGRLVLHTRERVVAIEPRGKGLLLSTLRAEDEVRDDAEFFDRIPAGKGDRKMIDIATRIIEQQEAEFDPSKFTDRYEAALRKVIARKGKGKSVVAPPPEEEEKVVDLMEALKRSLGSGGEKSARAERFIAAQKPKAKAKAKGVKRRKKAA